MKTKQTLLTTGCVLLISFACIAQEPMDPGPHHGKKEMIEAQKIAFITKHLDLSPEEAQVFWPVYNQCDKEKKELRKTHKEQFKKGQEHNSLESLDEMTDKEVEALIDNEMDLRQKDLDLQKACHAKYKEVLPIKKVAKLHRAEEQFKRELLKKMREHKERPERPERPDRW
ncbi:MAG: hypothetical protein ABII90_00625 [Bacteroidota bacterium]